MHVHTHTHTHTHTHRGWQQKYLGLSPIRGSVARERSLQPAYGEGPTSFRQPVFVESQTESWASHGTSGKKLKTKKPHLQCRRCRRPRFDPWVGKIPWRKAQQPTPIFLPGEAHEQRSLVDHSPWDLKESDKTDATEHACIQNHTELHSRQNQYNIVK